MPPLLFRLSNLQNLVGLYVLEYLHDAARPSDFQAGDLFNLPQSEMYSKMTRGGVSASAAHVVILFVDAHARPDPVAIALGSCELEDDPMVRIWAHVLPQLCPILKRSNDNIDFAVVIEIRESAAAMRAGRLKILASLRRYVLEGPISEIRKNSVWLLISRGLEHFHVVVYVRARGEQVFPSVIVQVKEARAPPASLNRKGREACAVGRVFEQAAPDVTKKGKRLVRQTHDVDVRKTVVVIIPEIRPHARYRLAAVQQSHARQHPYFFKGPVAAVMKQEILLVVVGHEDVHKPV